MTSSELLALAESRFVSLTTFRKTGVRVSTPVWIAREGDRLVVTTPADSGKVKRLRNDGRVELQPCTRSGNVEEADPLVSGHARIESDPSEVDRLGGLFRRKYGAEYRVFMLVERLARRGNPTRVMLTIGD